MWGFLIQNLYGSASIIFYVVVCWLVVRERRYFCPTFVKLFITFAVFNILSYITIDLVMRLPKHISRGTVFGEFLSHFPFPRLLSFMLFLGYYFCYCQHLSLFFLILHRMRAITFPFSREAIWDTHYWMTIVFIVGFPICFCYRLLLTDIHYKYKSQMGGYFLSAINKHLIDSSKDELLQLTIFQCVVTLLSVLANATSILMLCRRSMSSNYKRELNLFLISFLGFCVQAISSALSAGLYVFEPDSTASNLFICFLPYCNDLFSLGIPYFILVFNARIRKCFFDLPAFVKISNIGMHNKCDKSCQHLSPNDNDGSTVML